MSARRQSCQRAERRSSCCWWVGSCKPRAMTANSALPNGWRCASSPARTRSPGPRRHSRNFGATTRGTASQAIKALEAGGYLVRQRSEADGRSVSLRLTNKGKKALARDPFEVLVRAVDSLDAKEQTAMHHALHQVLTTVAASGAHRRFGVCQDCTYLGGEMCCNLTSASPSAFKCLLFGVPIEPADAGLLCVHFQPKSEHREDGHRE